MPTILLLALVGIGFTDLKTAAPHDPSVFTALVKSKYGSLVGEVSSYVEHSSEFLGKTFQAAQLPHERFLTIDHSCKIFS